jgi:hypothetical protein
LVVNNNSTDDTDEILARYTGALPLRRLFEPKQGHSYARNCAIEAARGDLLIWTDDDVLVDEDWLAEYVAAAQAYPGASYFGGPIEPWFESDRPPWMCRHWARIEGIFVLRDYGPEVRPFTAGESPAGANMAFRTDLLRSMPFDVGLGRVGATLTGADDTNMIDRVRQSDKDGVWIGTARVKHFLPAERLTQLFVGRWYQGAGRTEIRQHGLAECPRVFGMPRWALLKLTRLQLRCWCLSPFKNSHWLESFCEVSILRGFLSEARQRCRHRSAEAGSHVAEQDTALQAKTLSNR